MFCPLLLHYQCCIYFYAYFEPKSSFFWIGSIQTPPPPPTSPFIYWSIVHNHWQLKGAGLGMVSFPHVPWYCTVYFLLSISQSIIVVDTWFLLLRNPELLCFKLRGDGKRIFIIKVQYKMHLTLVKVDLLISCSWNGLHPSFE
jgi:hypothetical protein